jgi:hypothetical protein
VKPLEALACGFVLFSLGAVTSQLLQPAHRHVAARGVEATRETSRAVASPEWHAANSRVPAAADPPAGSARPPREPGPVVAEEEEAMTSDEIQYRLDHQYRSAPRDQTAGGRVAEQTISDALRAEADNGASLQEVGCRGNLCEVKVHLRDGDSDRQVMGHLFRGVDARIRMGAVMVASRETRDDNSIDATIYIAREGDISLQD